MMIRNRKLWAIGGALCAALVGAGVAWAVLTLRADIDGGGEVKAPAGLEFVGTPSTSGLDTAACTVSQTGGVLNLNFSGFPGEQCEITTAVRRTGDTSGAGQRISHVVFSDRTTETISDSCGVVVTSSAGGTSFRFRVTADATPGTFTATPDAGLVTTDNTPACGP